MSCLKKKGASLLELVLIVAILFIVVESIYSIVPLFFRMSSVSRESLQQLSNSQTLIAYFNKYLTHVDLMYLGRKSSTLSSGDPEKNKKKIFFRRTYLVPTGFNGKTDSFKTSWGCFWFKETEKTIKYFQSDEVSFHRDSSLKWKEIVSFSLENIDFSYDSKKLTVKLAFRRGKKGLNHRKLIFFNDASQMLEEDATRLDDLEEPHWL